MIKSMGERVEGREGREGHLDNVVEHQSNEFVGTIILSLLRKGMSEGDRTG